MFGAELKAEQKYALKVLFQGIHLDKGGDLLVAIHSTKDSFPSDWQNAYRSKKVRLDKSGMAPVVFENMAIGEYSLIAIQDIDQDGRMTKNWIGYPLEPFGTSNNPKFFGPPKFSKALFEFKENMEIEVKLVDF